MSYRLLRLLLVFALALAVPLQGYAAASAGVCMAIGHHDAPAMDGHGEHTDGHDHGQPADSPAHCPPCVACCASAVIAPSVLLVSLDERTEVLNAAAPPFLAGIQRTVVDRPPLFL